NHHSYLFLQPTRILTANTLEEIPALFAQIETALSEGLYLAGYLSYECNAHFEPSTARQPDQSSPSAQDLPLAHLAAYPTPIIFDHATGTFLNPTPQLNSVILSEARSAQPKDPDTLDHATTLRPFQPAS